MPTSNIDILAEINSISKIHTLHSDDIDSIMKEFAERITKTLHIERLSVWILSPDKESISSMGEFDNLSNSFNKGNTLYKKDCPNYFRSVESNEVLVVANVKENKATTELVADYFNKHNVISLMDIPLRIGGDLIGVMCYEKTGSDERVFSEKDQLFALSVGFVFSSNVEARHRRTIQHLLDEELKEKDTLIKEINHRVKNNIAVVSSLLRMQFSKARDPFHKELFEECQNKIEAISSIHRITQNVDNFGFVNVQEFVENLIKDLLDFHASDEKDIIIAQEIASIIITIDQAVPVALIINEVITNAYKHAFSNRKEGVILVKIKEVDKQVALEISDNGIGFIPKDNKDESMGIEIIKGLCEQIDGKMSYGHNDGAVFTMTFPK